MRDFADLLDRLQETRDRTEQALHLGRYLLRRAPEEAAAAVHLMLGGPAGPRLPATLLEASAARAAGLPLEVFRACRSAAGDTAEAIGLAVPSPRAPDDGRLGDWLHRRLPALHALPAEAQADELARLWPSLGPGPRRVLAELLQGGLRRPPGADLVAALLAEALGLDPSLTAHRLATFRHDPTPASFTAVTAPAAATEPLPAPFSPLATLESAPLAAAGRWTGWHPDGLRAQLVRRGDEVALWSETPQRLNTRFLDLVDTARVVLPPDTVLDGWIVAADAKGLAQRLGARPLGRTAQARDPVRFVALDTLQWAGEPLQHQPLRARMALLAEHFAATASAIAPAMAYPVPDAGMRPCDHAEGRRLRAAGLLSADLDGTGAWSRWPLPPLTVQVLLVYAQAGPRGYEHFSFAVQGSTGPTTVAKLALPATGEWARQLADTVRETSVRRIGPIHEVAPQHVYELAFDALDESPRHKCGLLLREARLLRPRDDLTPQQADTLEHLQRLLHAP